MTKAALDGVRVVEFATMVSGPYCGKLLADMGADVIKVEPPGGDPARGCGPFPDEVPHPERSALFLYLNANKRGIALDLDRGEDLDAFVRLVQGADVLIDNHAPELLQGRGLDWEALVRLNPDLIYTSITPYGRTGPRSGVKGDELTLIHAGGLANLLPARSVDIDFPPVKMGGYFVGYHGGLAAALATLSLLSGGDTPRGRLVDVSLQEVILTLVSPIVASNRYHKTTWSRVPDRPPAMGRMETSDGYVILGAADDHHFKAFRELMGNPDWAEGDHWLDMHYRIHHLMDIAPKIEAWIRAQKKHDLHHRAARKRIPIGPVNTAEDVMNSAQYAARGFFVEVSHPVAGTHRYAGWSYRMSATPPSIRRPAPLLDQHRGEILESVRAADPLETPPSPDPHESSGATDPPRRSRLPLEGIRVLDFCWVWAGPFACRILADLGAEVIKIEGHKRMDLMRRTFPWPLPEPRPLRCPPNQGLSFNTVNLNKKSLTLDLSKPEGIEIARRLVAVSDVVVDNLRPGAMENLGLGYKDLRRFRPDIIAVSLSSRGSGGPESDYLGFATIHQAVGGVVHISGHPDDHPTTGSPGDADIMNAMTTAFATLAALHHRRRTGEGQRIDCSQCEGVSSLIGEVLLGYEMTGRIPERMGNAHPVYAPHNLYRCWGVDRWLALEIHSDEEFAALARVMGRSELAGDPRFSDMASRKKNERELDRIIQSWTRWRDRDWLVGELCNAGLAAAPSREGRDLYADPHLKARGAFITIEHPELGPLELAGPPWRISDMAPPAVHAPLLGEHNRYVLQGLLGMEEGQIAELREKDVIL